MGLRDRGLRLAGYLTPPSDVTQEEDDAAERYTLHSKSMRIELRF